MTLALATKTLDNGSKPDLQLAEQGIRVAVVVPTHWEYRMGGSQYQAKLLIECLAGRGVKEIAFFSARVPTDAMQTDHRVVKTGTASALRRFGHFWDYFSLQRRLKEFRPDVIYQRVRCSLTGIAARYAEKHQVPMIWHVASDRDCFAKLPFWNNIRSPHSALEAMLGAYGMHRANYVVVQTAMQKEMLLGNYGIVAHALIRNFQPIPNDPIRKRRPLTILWIANLKEIKRPELFLDISSCLRQKSEIRLKIIGAPFPKEKLQSEFMARIQTLSNVEYLGKLNQHEVNELLSRAHLLVNTSRFEGFSNTFIQAWLREVPVLTLGVNPDNLLDNDVFGECCQSVQELATAILELSADPDRLLKIGRECRSKSVNMFSMNNGEQLVDLILSVANRGKSGPSKDLEKI